MKRAILMLFIIVCKPCFTLTAHQLCQGKVTYIFDGDTVQFQCSNNHKTFKVRLAEIDTPETTKSYQPCFAQPYGQKAKKALANRVKNQSLTLAVIDTDAYGRLVGKLSDKQGSINAYMVKNGFAHHYRHYSTSQTLAQYEEDARRQHIGLWSLAPVCVIEPWRWRNQFTQRARCKKQVVFMHQCGRQ